MKTRSILLILALALVVAPMADAYHPHSLNVQSEAVHGYFGPGGSGRLVWDGHEVTTGVYDGDTEQGIGVGRFIVSMADATYGCTNHPAEIPHHRNYEVWAKDFYAPIVYTAGSEGPDATSIGECISNGIISDNPITDPNDCGSGKTGIYHSYWLPATVERNWNLAPPCGSFDGDVWGFVLAGVFITPTGPVSSTPVQGHMWTS